MNHVIAASQPLHWLRFLQHHVVGLKVTSSVFQCAMSKKRTILSLDQQIEVLSLRLGEAYRVERLLPSQRCETQMAHVEAIMSEWNSSDLVDIKYVKRHKMTYVEYKYSRTDICCINVRFNNYSLHNYDNARIQYEYRW